MFEYKSLREARQEAFDEDILREAWSDAARAAAAAARRARGRGVGLQSQLAAGRKAYIKKLSPEGRKRASDMFSASDERATNKHMSLGEFSPRRPNKKTRAQLKRLNTRSKIKYGLEQRARLGRARYRMS